MSGEGGLFARQEAQDLLGAEVARYIPSGSAAVVIEISALAPVSSFLFWSEARDGSRESIPMDMDFDTALIARLRQAMYRSGAGTWFSAVVRVDRSGVVDGHFDYDSEPDWDAPVDPIAYLTDAEKYPRDVENQPDWLRAKLAEGYGRRAARS
ncbi:MAG TPA: hypothetical protein VGN37_16030 [Actinocatenispora sp.]